MESQVPAFSTSGQRPVEMATLPNAHALHGEPAGAHGQTSPGKNLKGKGGKRNGRKMTAITMEILKLSVGESILISNLTLEQVRYSTKTVRRAGYIIRCRTRSHGVRVERLS